MRRRRDRRLRAPSGIDSASLQGQDGAPGPGAPVPPPVSPAFLARYGMLDEVRRQAVLAASAEAVPRPAGAPGGGGAWRRARSTSPRAQLRRGERLPMRRDRRGEILERLGQGPASAHELAESFGISREAVLRWLRLLEADGKVKATAAARTSRENRWVLARG